MLSTELLSYLDSHMLDKRLCYVHTVKAGTLSNYHNRTGFTLIICNSYPALKNAMWELKTALDIRAIKCKADISRNQIQTANSLFMFVSSNISVDKIAGLIFTRVLEYV